MKVAVITDVHASLPALEAALRRIETLGMETIYCGGDSSATDYTRTRSAR